MTRRGARFLFFVFLVAHGSPVRGQTPLLDVPFISQSEALCGGAAAAMVLRYWGEREVSAESFENLVDRSAAGIRTDALIGDLKRRGWNAAGIEGTDELVRRELAQGRPVVALIEDRPGAYHYVVVVAWPERGVVFHDPARSPFRVMPAGEFVRRWKAADNWMAVIVPGVGASASVTPPKPAPLEDSPGACDRLVARGVSAAHANDLEGAEQALTSALSCPGPAATRELAGVRLLQRRWPEVADLAATAVAIDPADTYAWKLLGTARFVENDRLGALRAWNRAGEPRLDLVQVDGLRRTRHRVVENLLAVPAGETLTDGAFARARRRLAELPAAYSTRLDYVPVPGGLAELRGSVAERDLFPRAPLSMAALAAVAAATREVRVTLGPIAGGGERISAAWRFWPRRQRLAIAVDAPAPWGGIWGIDGVKERQSFTSPLVAAAERTGAHLTQSNWATGSLRWNVGGGLDRWQNLGTFGNVSGGLRFVAPGDRVEARVQAAGWRGSSGFTTAHASLHARSSTERRGLVFVGVASSDVASARTPLDLRPAGDVGLVRSTLLRAHPLLDDGRIRDARLGRHLHGATVEAQHWWQVAAPFRAAAAAFLDGARTSGRLAARARTDADVGVGIRAAVTAMPGIFRIDIARGLRDRASAISFVYVVE